MSLIIRPPAELPSYNNNKTINGTITTNNSVQIGIQNTSSVASSPTAGAAIQVVSNDGAAMASGDRLGGLFIAGAADASNSIISSAAILAFTTEAWSGSAAGTSIQIQTVSTGVASRTTKLTIDGSGNVGIGTTAPLGKLHITGTALVGAEPTYRGDIIIDQTGVAAAGNGGLEFKAANGGSGYGFRIIDLLNGGANGYNPTIQTRHSSATWTTRLTIDGVNGRLGIANSAPSYMLDVTGDGRFTTGLNMGTATGAGTGAIRASSSLTILSLASTGAYTSDSAYKGVKGSISGSVTAGDSLIIDGYGSQVFLMLSDSGGHNTIVGLCGGSNTVQLQGFSSSAFNVNSDAGTVWAIFHNGTNYVIKNRTGSTRSFSALVLG